MVPPARHPGQAQREPFPPHERLRDGPRLKAGVTV